MERGRRDREKGLRRGDIERRREERGVNGELHMEVACSGPEVDRLRSPRPLQGTMEKIEIFGEFEMKMSQY